MGVDTTTMRSTNPLTILLTSNASILVLRVLIGGLFVFSSLHKIEDPGAFAVAIRGYKLLPASLSNIFALFVAWSELVSGVMLVLGVFTKKAAGAIAILLLMFIGAIGTTMIRGIAVDCGCFSNKGGQQTSDLFLIVRNVFLLAAAVIVMHFDRGAFSLSNTFSRGRRTDS